MTSFIRDIANFDAPKDVFDVCLLSTHSITVFLTLYQPPGCSNWKPGSRSLSLFYPYLTSASPGLEVSRIHLLLSNTGVTKPQPPPLPHLPWPEMASPLISVRLCDPVNRNPGFSVQGSFQARILAWVAMSFSRGSS